MTVLSEQEFRVKSDAALEAARRALLALADSDGFEVELAAPVAATRLPPARPPHPPPRPGDRPAANPHSPRSVVMGRNGMIATSQPLASAAGLKVLQDGGNAIDAAVTAAAVLAVVEPSMTGIGGDLFAIVYDAKTKTLKALNASGRSAYAATPDVFARRNLTRVPNSGA